MQEVKAAMQAISCLREKRALSINAEAELSRREKPSLRRSPAKWPQSGVAVGGVKVMQMVSEGAEKIAQRS
jgi:hypothetical protein